MKIPTTKINKVTQAVRDALLLRRLENGALRTKANSTSATTDRK